MVKWSRTQLVPIYRREYEFPEPIEDLDFVLENYIDPALAGLRKGERAVRSGTEIVYARRKERLLVRTEETVVFRLRVEPVPDGMLVVAEGPSEEAVWQVLDGLGEMRSEELIFDPEEVRRAAEEARRAAIVKATPEPGAPEGWYPYPDDKIRERWWNGSEWTDNVRY
jgi:Protein of unknown function (DUF2510)